MDCCCSRTYLYRELGRLQAEDKRDFIKLVESNFCPDEAEWFSVIQQRL